MNVLKELIPNIQKAEKLMQDHFLKHGQVIPIIANPDGSKPIGANYENTCYLTGLYLAAEAIFYSRDKHESSLTRSNQCLEALLRLETVTGETGLVARAIKSGDKASWDERFFWEKKSDKTRRETEWHKHEDEKTRFLTDPSKSSMFGFTFGLFAYQFFIQPDPEMRGKIAGVYERVIKRIRKNNDTIQDLDGKDSGHGNYRNKKRIGPLLMLGMLKLQHKLSGQPAHEKAYNEYFDEHKNDPYIRNGRNDTFIRRRLMSPSGCGSEDNLIFLNLYMLHHLEMDEIKKQVYINLLEKSWSKIYTPKNSLLHFIYRTCRGTEPMEITDATDTLLAFPVEKQVACIAQKREYGFKRGLKSLRNPRPFEQWTDFEYLWRENPYFKAEWVPQMKGQMRFSPVDFLLATYMGAKHKLVKSN